MHHLAAILKEDIGLHEQDIPDEPQDSDDEGKNEEDEDEDEDPGGPGLGQAAQDAGIQAQARYPSRARARPGAWWRTHPEIAAAAIIEEPLTYEEALSSEQAAEWRQAMDDEIKSLHANQTWTTEPSPKGVKAAKGLMRYVASTREHGIRTDLFETSPNTVVGYCDADYAGDPDTRRSTTGFVFILHGGVFTWLSKRQPTVAASTTEAEYISAAQAVKEALWLRVLLADLGIVVNTFQIKGDNQSVLKLLKNPVSSMRLKHIDVVYHFARERVARREVESSYVNTNEMLADMLTKPVPGNKLQICCSNIGVE